MGKNMKPLENEKGKILAFRKSRFNVSSIAKKVSRSRTVVNNVLPNIKKCGNRKHSGRPLKLSPTAFCRLFREASKGEKSSRNLKTSLDLYVTSRRVLQILHDSKNFIYKNSKKAPAFMKKRRSH